MSWYNRPGSYKAKHSREGVTTPRLERHGRLWWKETQEEVIKPLDYETTLKELKEYCGTLECTLIHHSLANKNFKQLTWKPVQNTYHFEGRVRGVVTKSEHATLEEAVQEFVDFYLPSN